VSNIADMLRPILTFVVALLLLVTQPVLAARDTVDYQLGTGDKLRVTVFGQEDMSGEFDVDDTGQIALPLVGNIKVAGKSIRAAERQLVDALSPEYLINPKVNIQVLNYRPFYIIGEVNSPGSYPFVNGMTVTEAVALAGGYTYRAKEKEVLIIRASDAARAEEPATETTAILPGDVIKVPERFF
jgi:protein involved in polysaccharide export with SLBB domain